MFRRRKIEPIDTREPWKRPTDIKRRTTNDDLVYRALRKYREDRDMMIYNANLNRPNRNKETIEMLVKGIKNLSNKRNEQSYQDEGWY